MLNGSGGQSRVVVQLVWLAAGGCACGRWATGDDLRADQLDYQPVPIAFWAQPDDLPDRIRVLDQIASSVRAGVPAVATVVVRGTAVLECVAVPGEGDATYEVAIRFVCQCPDATIRDGRTIRRELVPTSVVAQVNGRASDR